MRALLLTVALILGTHAARAGELEAIRLTYAAPAACPTREKRMEEIALTGGKLREATPESPATRTFLVTIEAGSPLRGTLVVRDVAAAAVPRSTWTFVGIVLAGAVLTTTAFFVGGHHGRLPAPGTTAALVGSPPIAPAEVAVAPPLPIPTGSATPHGTLDPLTVNASSPTPARAVSKREGVGTPPPLPSLPSELAIYGKPGPLWRATTPTRRSKFSAATGRFSPRAPSRKKRT